MWLNDFGTGFAASDTAFFGGEVECFFVVDLGLTDEFVGAVGFGDYPNLVVGRRAMSAEEPKAGFQD